MEHKVFQNEKYFQFSLKSSDKAYLTVVRVKSNMNKLKNKIKELKPITLKEYWKTEKALVQYLATKKQIKRLGRTIGKELTNVCLEKQIGSYRVDMQVFSETDKANVIIENQLEETDHKHLGQVLTYLSNSNAKTAVWISNKINPEHRRALDYLNSLEPYKEFFGIELQFFKSKDRIQSYFKVVSHPANWTSKKSKSIIFFNDFIEEIRAEYPKLHIKHTVNNSIHITLSKNYKHINIFRAINPHRIGVDIIPHERTMRQDEKLIENLKQDIFKKKLRSFEYCKEERFVGAYKRITDIHDEETYAFQMKWLKKRALDLYKRVDKNIALLEAEEKMDKAS